MAIRMDYNRGLTKEVILSSSGSGDTLATTLEIGDAVRVGDLVGVLMTEPVVGDDDEMWGTVALTGVLSSVGEAHLSSEAIDQGTPIYTSTSADADGHAVKATLTTTEGSAPPNKLFGYALNTRATATGNIEIKVVN